MTSRFLASVFALVIACGPAVAYAASAPAPVMQTVNGIMAAVNASDATALQSYFSPDAVVVDEESPFVWRSPNAALAWWHRVERTERREGIATLRAQIHGVQEYRVDREGDDAYVEVNLTIMMKMADGRTRTEPGVWTLTMHRFAGTWKVTTATWTTVSA
jgi:ketosteroid isomerase-like protein